MFHVKQTAAHLDLRLRRWLAHRLRRAAWRIDGRIAMVVGNGVVELGVDARTLEACVEAAMPEIGAAIDRHARIAIAAREELNFIVAKGAKR